MFSETPYFWKSPPCHSTYQYLNVDLLSGIDLLWLLNHHILSQNHWLCCSIRTLCNLHMFNDVVILYLIFQLLFDLRLFVPSFRTTCDFIESSTRCSHLHISSSSIIIQILHLLSITRDDRISSGRGIVGSQSCFQLLLISARIQSNLYLLDLQLMFRWSIV